MTDQYVELAKRAIETFVEEGKVLEIPSDLPKEFLSRGAGVFVTLFKKSSGELRGCVGTFIPTCKNIATEIIQNAISACTRDLRFPPLSPSELENLNIKVDILSEPESFPFNPLTPSTPSSSLFQFLNPQKYGLIVKSQGGKTGLLLPDIPSVTTGEQQIQICKQKACVESEEPVKLFRFTVERHEE